MIEEPPHCNADCPNIGWRLALGLPCCRDITDMDPLAIPPPPFLPTLPPAMVTA